VPYFLVHFLRSGGKRTWAGARNLFFDYFVTPRVAFLPRNLVEGWCGVAGGRILHYEENRGQNVHSFLVQKEPAAASSHRAAAPRPEAMAVAERPETT
jgi:hypothetical protein